MLSIWLATAGFIPQRSPDCKQLGDVMHKFVDVCYVLSIFSFVNKSFVSVGICFNIRSSILNAQAV